MSPSGRSKKKFPEDYEEQTEAFQSDTPAPPLPETAEPVLQDADEKKKKLEELRGAVTEEREVMKAKRMPKKKKEDSQEEEAATAELEAAVGDFSMAVEFATQIVIERLPNPKPLTAVEKEAWNRVNNRVLRRLIPQMEGWADYAAWAGVFALVMLPRLKKPKLEPLNLQPLEIKKPEPPPPVDLNASPGIS